MSVRGWVYVIENHAMPGIVKVGFSTKDPNLRAKELEGSGIPRPFKLVYDALVIEPRSVEQAAHSILDASREGKEWFRCSRITAIEAIRQSAVEILVEQHYFQPDAPQELNSHSCDFQPCNNAGAKSYKGVFYCFEHYKQLRQWRFDAARQKR
jgi:hypothetical protein